MPKRLQNERFPVVRQIDSRLDASAVFMALSVLPGRVWLDSATGSSLSESGGGIDADIDDAVRRMSRYSFLTADPIHRLVAFPDQPNPWDEISRLADRLPHDVDPDLPPFQGGIVGVLGYEASRWLEPDELATCHGEQRDDLPTPAVSIGVYNWTIAIDHSSQSSWLICQGFSVDDLSPTEGSGKQKTSASERFRNANARADQISDLISRYELDRPSRRLDFLANSNLQISEKKERAIAEAGQTVCGSPIRSETHGNGDVSSNFTSEQFQASVAEIVRRIRNGDFFQVNLAQRLVTHSTLDPASLYLRLRETNPAPFAGFYDGGTFQVISSSPEDFLRIRNRHVETRPIKGTAPRTGDEGSDKARAVDLLASEKDRAENIMIVDLMRNDLSRVCRDESVVVSQMCEIERYQFVQHLVSVVEGELIEGLNAVDALKACFPGGSVTGAPKIEAMKTIAQLEPHPRGPYCGSLGYISCGGDSDFNILIRTITSTGDQLQIPVGGGITARSNPAAEEAETWAKAAGMLWALPEESTSNPESVDRRENPNVAGVV